MRSSDQLREIPHVIGELGFHRACDPQSLVNPAKVVVVEVQVVRGLLLRGLPPMILQELLVDRLATSKTVLGAVPEANLIFAQLPA